MKITGPGSSLPPDLAADIDEPAGPSKKPFTEKAQEAEKGAGAAHDGHSVERLGGAGAGPVADIGADLHAGRITPEIAIERVIDRVLDLQVGSHAPAAVRESVGAALRQALENDPLLAEKIRALGA